MKAVVHERYGPPDVLRTADVERPVVKAGEVLIRVRAAEAAKSDCEMRGFRFPVSWFWLPLRLAVGIRRPRRPILGGYLAGEIAAVGEGTAGFVPGEAVFGTTGLRMGAYGTYVALPATATLATKPDSMTFEEAAAVPLGGLNALHFMRLAAIRAGERILINGAGGSIGLHAVQIAKSRGAEVTAVDHGIKEALLRRMGADRFIDYAKADIAADGRTYDVVFDMVPDSAYATCIGVLEPDGRYLCGNPRLSVMVRSLLTTWLTDRTARFAFARESRDELIELGRMIEQGEIRSIVDRVFPMEQAADAHRLVENEQRLGAVVIAIDDTSADRATDTGEGG